jgi:hypothetical protein
MPEFRKNPRYRTLAHACIPGVMEGENLLKDISVTGCCVESTVIVDVKPGTEYFIEIRPEVVSKIDKFKLQVERKWIRNDGYSTEVGFNIIASPKGKQFEYYIDYLAYRSSIK